MPAGAAAPTEFPPCGRRWSPTRYRPHVDDSPPTPVNVVADIFAVRSTEKIKEKNKTKQKVRAQKTNQNISQGRPSSVRLWQPHRRARPPSNPTSHMQDLSSKTSSLVQKSPAGQRHSLVATQHVLARTNTRKSRQTHKHPFSPRSSRRKWGGDAKRSKPLCSRSTCVCPPDRPRSSCNATRATATTTPRPSW